MVGKLLREKDVRKIKSKTLLDRQRTLFCHLIGGGELKINAILYIYISANFSISKDCCILIRKRLWRLLRILKVLSVR